MYRSKNLPGGGNPSVQVFSDHRINLSLAAPESLTKRCLLALFFCADVFVLNVLLAGEAGFPLVVRFFVAS